MDIETIVSLALLLFYLIYQFRSKKPRPDPQPDRSLPPIRTGQRPVPQSYEASDGGSELERALREIQQSLGNPAPRPTPAPLPPPKAAPAAARPQSVAGPGSGFRREEKFERKKGPQPAKVREFKPAGALSHKKPAKATFQELDTFEQESDVHGWRHDSAAVLRDALISAEVLGPPRARRRPGYKD